MMWRSTGNARADGGIEAAADGIGVPAELGLAQKEDRHRDNDRGENDRIGKNCIHPPEQIAAHIRPLKEMEAAPLAPDIVDQGVIAIVAYAGRQADHRGVFRHQKRDPADDEGTAQGHDEGRHLQLGNDCAIEEPDKTGSAERGQQSDDYRGKERKPGVEHGSGRQGRDDGGEDS